jgi:hypothetical protein
MMSRILASSLLLLALAAGCASAAEHLLRQQHEAELARAQVGALGRAWGGS